MSFDLETLKSKLRGKKIITVESCTGGLLAARFTSIAGSSSYFWGGYVTYDNDAKIKLGVNEPILHQFGAVSPQVALEMARAGRGNSDFCIAITGIAGPDGGTPGKPVGLVYIAINNDVREFRFNGDRESIRTQTVEAALIWLDSLL